MLEWAGWAKWREGGREVEVVGVESRRRLRNIVRRGGKGRGGGVGSVRGGDGGEEREDGKEGEEGDQVLIVRAGVDPRRPKEDQHRLRCTNPDR